MNINTEFQHQQYLILCDWIDIKHINWQRLSSNPNAICLLEARILEEMEYLSFGKAIEPQVPRTLGVLSQRSLISSPDKIDWLELSYNPNAIYLLEANPDNINWEYLSANTNAIHLLEANLDKIDWYWLGLNPNAIHLFEANPEKINWIYLSNNLNAIHLLEANPEKINWSYLSMNLNAIHLLEANPDKINWSQLSANPNAIHLLEANPDEIEWSWLSRNPNAIHLLEATPAQIDWRWIGLNTNAIDLLKDRMFKEVNEMGPHINNGLTWDFICRNPNAIHLLEAYPDKINWSQLSKNPSIFTYNYEKISKERAQTHKELIEYLHQPRFIQRWLEAGNELEDYLA